MPGNAEVEKRRFEIKLLRGATIDELVTFTERELAGAQIRQLAPVVQQAALKFGMATLLLGEYAGFDVHASAMCKDKAEGLSTGGFVHTWFYLKLKDHRAQYSFNLTDSDAGIILLPASPEPNGIEPSAPNLKPAAAAAESMESISGDQIFETLIEPGLPVTSDNIIAIPVSLDPTIDHQSLKSSIDALPDVPENRSRQSAATETQPMKAATDWDELFAPKPSAKNAIASSAAIHHSPAPR